MYNSVYVADPGALGGAWIDHNTNDGTDILPQHLLHRIMHNSHRRIYDTKVVKPIKDSRAPLQASHYSAALISVSTLMDMGDSY